MANEMAVFSAMVTGESPLSLSDDVRNPSSAAMTTAATTASTAIVRYWRRKKACAPVKIASETLRISAVPVSLASTWRARYAANPIASRLAPSGTASQTIISTCVFPLLHQVLASERCVEAGPRKRARPVAARRRERATRHAERALRHGDWTTGGRALRKKEPEQRG